MTQRFFLPSGSRMNAQKYSFRNIRQYASGHPPSVNQMRNRIANPMMMGYVTSTTATDHPFFDSFGSPPILLWISFTLPHPHLDLSQLFTAVGASATSFPNRASCIPRTLSSCAYTRGFLTFRSSRCAPILLSNALCVRV